MFDQDKTEPATPHRRQLAREKGEVGRSQDVVQSLLLLVTVLIFAQVGTILVGSIVSWSVSLYSAPLQWGDAPEAIPIFLSLSALNLLLAVAPWVLLQATVVIIAHLTQVGWLFLPEKLVPDWNRINPYNGLAKIFSLESVTRLGMMTGKTIGILLIVWLILWSQRVTIMEMSDVAVGEFVAFTFALLLKVALLSAVFLLFLAVLDLLWQRWKFEQSIKMTPEEIRQEMKEALGDPLVLEKRRELQLKTSKNRQK